MARTIQMAKPMSNLTSSSPKLSPLLHTDFVEVKVHTAKCDSCDKHNKLTLYRCTECGLHVCSLCWDKKSGDRVHAFAGGFSNAPEPYANYVDAESGGKIPNENKCSARSGRRVHVVSDDEDDQFPLLKPAPTTQKSELSNTSKQQNAVMDNNHGRDYGDDSPRLWPIAPTQRLPVLRPAVPAANTSAIESATQMDQRSPRAYGEQRQEIMQAHENLGRQRMSSQHASIENQETNTQARRPSQSSIPHQQATRSAPLLNQRVILRQPRVVDRDRQAARNQAAFPNEYSRNFQGPRPAQPLNAHQQQATQFDPRHFQRANYRPQSGADLNQQAARNQQEAYLQRQAYDSYLRAYLSQQQANRPSPGQVQASTSNGLPSHGLPTDSFRSQSQAFLSQQYAALRASREARDRIITQERPDRTSAFYQGREPSPEIMNGADVVRFYAGADQIPGVRFWSDQDASGISQLLSAAHQLEKAGSDDAKSRSSSKTLLKDSGAAGTQSASSRGPAPNPSPGSTDSDSVKARIEKHRARLAGLHLSASTQNTVPDLPTSQPGHPSHRQAAKQPETGPALANSSAPQSQGSSFRRAAQSHPGPRPPMSEHAATYINHWDSARAALSASSNNTAAAAPATQPDHPRSPVPAPDSRSTTGAQGEKARTETPVPISGLHIEGRAEKRQRSEEKDDHETSKKQKGMGAGDVDVADAKKGNSKEKQIELSDDDSSDVVITSSRKVDSSKTSDNYRGTDAGAKGSEPGRVIKKGVARMKKPMPKGRKG